MGNPDKLGPLALDIMAWSRVADLKADAAELCQIIEAMARPVPLMPTDSREREFALTIQILRERERIRALLALWQDAPEVA